MGIHKHVNTVELLDFMEAQLSWSFMESLTQKLHLQKNNKSVLIEIH